MIYYPDAFLDNLLMEDIQYGDLTSRALNIGDHIGTMTFTRREAGCVSGITLVHFRVDPHLVQHIHCINIRRKSRNISTQ